MLTLTQKEKSKRKLETKKKKRYSKCERCPYMYTDHYCMLKDHGFLSKRCFRRLFL